MQPYHIVVYCHIAEISVIWKFDAILTELCHIAHFWESYGRCTMHELPMG